MLRGRKHSTISAVTAGIGRAGTSSSGGSDIKDMVLLRDLGDLITGKVVRRPSASVRTPYVADVALASSDQVLAHTPALDCAGLIVPGGRVHMTKNPPPKPGAQPTKTTHSVQLAEEPREDGTHALVGAHPSLAEGFAEAALQRRLVPELGAYNRILRQQALGSSRVDFVLEMEGGGVTLVEVKNVVCADYPEGGVPEGRSKVGVYTSPASPYTRTALFPHGAQKKAIGVVSDRAIKHIHELTTLQLHGSFQPPPGMVKALSPGGGSKAGQGRKAAGRGRKNDGDGEEEGVADGGASGAVAGGGVGVGGPQVPVNCCILFIVNRADCGAFRPCHEACPTFARMLRKAEDSGVLVLAYAIDWQGGKASWGRRIPVTYGVGVSGDDVDESHLARILEFNATDPRTHYKSATPQKKKQGSRASDAPGVLPHAAAAAAGIEAGAAAAAATAACTVAAEARSGGGASRKAARGAVLIRNRGAGKRQAAGVRGAAAAPPPPPLPPPPGPEATMLVSSAEAPVRRSGRTTAVSKSAATAGRVAHVDGSDSAAAAAAVDPAVSFTATGTGPISSAKRRRAQAEGHERADNAVGGDGSRTGSLGAGAAAIGRRGARARAK